MTSDAPGRLYVVTGNHVVDHHADDLAPTGPPAGRRAAAGPRPHRPRTLVAAGAGLTVLLALLGSQQWPLPGRDGGGPSDVPHALLTFLLLCAAPCVWAAGRLVRPADTLRSAGAVSLWWGVLAGAAAVSVAAALSLASYAGAGQEPPDLVVRCLVPLVPAVLAAVLAADAGRTPRIRAALGTGLVTVPLTGLGWALAGSTAGTPTSLGDALAMTVVTGMAPLALAVAFTVSDRRNRAAR